METSVMVPLIIGGAVLGFVLFWCLIMLLISAVSGWRKIAKAFPFNPAACGTQLEKFRFGNMTIGYNTKYTNAMTFTIFEGGLMIRPGLMFRAFHPPIFVDKQTLKTATFSGTQLYGFMQLNLEGRFISIFGKAVPAIQRFANSKNAFF